MHQIDAQGICHRYEQRSEDVQRRRGIQKASCDQKDNVDNDKENDRASSRHLLERRADGHIQSRPGQYVGEQAGRRRDEHDRRRSGDGVQKQGIKLLYPDLLIDEDPYEQSVDDGHGRRLCGGKDPSVDAAQDDNRHQQSPKGVPECVPAFLSGGFGQSLQLAFAAHQKRRNHQPQAHQKPRKDSGQEQGSDGGVRDGTVHHKGDGGRDDHSDGSRSSHERRRESGLVSCLDHGRDHDESQRRHRRRTGAGDGCEETGDDDAHDGKAAL